MAKSPLGKAGYARKIKTPEEIREIIGPRPRRKKVIMCHGTFDIVHPGHIRHLLYASGKADQLIASITADEHIKKGPYRPFVPQDLRAMNLAALEMVDYVVIDKNATPIENLQIIQPDFFAKGYEYQEGSLHPKTQEEVAVLESYGGEVIFTPGDIVYSSSALIEQAPPNLTYDKLHTLLEAEGVTFAALHAALDKLQGIRVHVLGDTIVDSHVQCTMIGGMTKTPTFSVRFESQTDFTGGAGIVAKHLRAAGADVVFTTVLGDDALRDFTMNDLGEAGITVHAIVDPSRPTTNKKVFIASDYRLLKVDTLDNRSINERTLNRICTYLRDTVVDAVVFSDFRHGIFNRTTIPALIDAIPDKVFRVADSQVASRWGNILEFHDFDLITPNEREARFSLADQESGVKPLALSIYERARCKTLILKLGDRGILTQRHLPSDQLRQTFVVDSFVDRLADAVGAGDALLAYATLVMVATGSEVMASVIGSCAAAVECEVDGNVPVRPEDIHAKLDALEKRASYAA